VRKLDTDIIGKHWIQDTIREDEEEEEGRIAASRLISRLIHCVSARVVLMHNACALVIVVFIEVSMLHRCRPRSCIFMPSVEKHDANCNHREVYDG